MAGGLLYTGPPSSLAYNAALGDGLDVELTTDEAKIDYAVAVATLVDPDVGGSERASLLMVPDRDALRNLVGRDPDGCSLSASKRKKAAKRATKAFEPPRVSRGPRGEMIEFFTWSSLNGEFVQHAVYISENGKVSMEREVTGSHLGDHVERN